MLNLQNCVYWRWVHSTSIPGAKNPCYATGSMNIVFHLYDLQLWPPSETLLNHANGHEKDTKHTLWCIWEHLKQRIRRGCGLAARLVTNKLNWSLSGRRTEWVVSRIFTWKEMENMAFDWSFSFPQILIVWISSQISE